MNNDLPENAKKVFQGKIFSVWQWEQELFDGSKTIFEKIGRTDSVSIIAIYNQKFAYLEEEQSHKGKFYSIPSGRMEENEIPLEAAKRELWEETGLQSNNWEELYNLTPSSMIDHTFHMLIAKNCYQTESVNPDAGEKIKVRYLNKEEFIAACMRDDFRDILFQNFLLKKHYRFELDKFFDNLLN